MERKFTIQEENELCMPIVEFGHKSIDHIMQFFTFDYLPDHLAEISKPFYDLAIHIAIRLPPNEETYVTLRKLLEARDAAVRSKLLMTT